MGPPCSMPTSTAGAKDPPGEKVGLSGEGVGEAADRDGGEHEGRGPGGERPDSGLFRTASRKGWHRLRGPGVGAVTLAGLGPLSPPVPTAGLAADESGRALWTCYRMWTDVSPYPVITYAFRPSLPFPGVPETERPPTSKGRVYPPCPRKLLERKELPQFRSVRESGKSR